MVEPKSKDAERRLRLAPDARVQVMENELRVVGPSRTGVAHCSAPVAKAVLGVMADWAGPERVFEAATVKVGADSGGVAMAVMTACKAAGALQEALFSGADCMVRIQVTPGSGMAPEDHVSNPDQPLVFQQAVCLTIENAEWHLTSPFAIGEAWIAGATMKRHLPEALDAWTPVSDLEKQIAVLLSDAGLLVSAGQSRRVAGLGDHELRLHAQSRRGTAAAAVGAVGVNAPRRAPAARQPDVSAKKIALPVPPKAPDMGLGQVFGARKSIRSNEGRAPLTGDDLGALLWIVARNLTDGIADGDGFERLSRPYPGAGGCHELDIFVALRDGGATVPGFSRYDAHQHALTLIDAEPEPLLKGAATAMGQTDHPEALLVLGARFDRLSWKYGDASYALILKNSGVLLQTLHLTSVALGLGSCILGGGDSHVFAKASGLDPCQCGPVGEIAIYGRLTLAETLGNTI